MPTTLTLTDVPGDLYVRLKQRADVHGRSVNDEAISVLQTVLFPSKAPNAERIARARAVRATLSAGAFFAKDIEAYKRQGRRQPSKHQPAPSIAEEGRHDVQSVKVSEGHHADVAGEPGDHSCGEGDPDAQPLAKRQLESMVPLGSLRRRSKPRRSTR